MLRNAPHRSCLLAGVLLFAAGVAWAQPTSQPQSQPASQPTSRPAAAKARIVFTGDTGGLASNRSRGPAFSALLRALRDREGHAHIERTGWAALRRRGRVIVGAGLRSSTLAAALGPLLAGKLERVAAPRVVQVLESESELVVQQPPHPRFDLLRLIRDEVKRRPRVYDPTLRRSTRRLTIYKLRSGERVYDLVEPRVAEASPPPRAAQWELWWSLQLVARIGAKKAPLLAVLKSWGTAPRRLRLVRALRRRAGAAPSLLVSGGDDVARDGPLRKLGFRALGELGYAALLPGETELWSGTKALLESAKKHALTYVAANVTWRASKGKAPVFRRYVRVDVGGLDVLVLGVVSRRFAKGLPDPKLLADVTIDDPLRATARVVDEVYKLPSAAPDLVVVLGNLRGRELARFRRRAYGVDVYIGDWTGHGHERLAQRVDVSRRRPRLESRGLLLAPRSSWIAVGEIGVHARGRGDLSRLTYRPHVITPRLPADLGWRQRLSAIYLAMLTRAEKQLMPSLESVMRGDKKLRERVGRDPHFSTTMSREEIAKTELWYTARLWGNIVANLLARSARADAVMLPPRNALGTNVPGPVRELYVKNWLQRTEMLRAVELSGKTLRRLVELARAARPDVIVTGLVPGRWLVGGRPLHDKERYRLLTTASLLASPAVARALAGAKPAARFTLREGRLRADDDGKPLALDKVVFDVLYRMRAKDPKLGDSSRAQIKRWLYPRGSEVVPRWSFAVKSLAVQFANYGNYPGRSWLRNSGIREQRTVTPNNYTFGVRGAFELEYDSANVTWTLGTQFKLARTVIDLSDVGNGDVDQEPLDDLVGSTELRLKFIEVSLGSAGRYKLIPYANVTFDSEFTATVNPITQASFPHQKELRVSAGIVSFPGRILREVRLAGLSKTDFTVERGKSEGGLLFGLGLHFPLWRAALDIGGTLRFFPNTSSDTIEDLGLIINGTAKLSVPIVRGLAVALFADYFIYRAKVLDVTDAATNEAARRGTAASVILGAGLTFDRIWKL